MCGKGNDFRNPITARMNMYRRCFILVCTITTWLGLFSVSIGATYTLTPQWNNLGPVQIEPGTPFNLKFDLTSTTGDICSSAIFDVAFSTPGIIVNDYSWGGSFNGSTFDNSDSTLYHFENFILSEPNFGTGTLLSMNVTLPIDIPILPSTITVHAQPGVFALGTQEFTPQAGPDLTIQVVPEPSAITLFIVSCLMLLASSFFRKI
jgi:hypothetical protein